MACYNLIIMTGYLADLKALKKIGFTNSNVEDGVLLTTLRRVQDMHLRPILGTSFYKRLLQGVADSDLNADETALLNDYIFPYLVATVDYRIVKPSTFQIRAKTTGTLQDSHINPITTADRLAMEDDLLQDSDGYRDILIGHLQDNCDKFPTYKNWVCSFENVAPQKEKARLNVRII